MPVEQLSHHVAEIIFATVFLLFGLTAAGIAILRRGKSVHILFWLALWSGTYGMRLLIMSPAVNMNFPPWLLALIPFADVSIAYLIIVFALLAWVELVREQMRYFIMIVFWAGLTTALAGIGWYLISGSPYSLMPYNNLIAACTLLVLFTVVAVRKLADKFLVLPNRGILATGTLLFATEALYTNFSNIFHYQTLPILGWLGFAVLLFSLAYAAAKIIFSNERRLIMIENELETARQIQASILPMTVPELRHLGVAAAYHPMTAVAGDFYDFVPIDSHRAGFLIADVSGHGVPAALIASMIKIAMQSVAADAREPAKVMQRLAAILGDQLRGQFLSAAYLYLDTETCRARYTAAGHPPLLYWDSSDQKERLIESNGLLIGVPAETDYPVCDFVFKKGDRFILYTDGLTEPENETGEAFGDERFPELIRSKPNLPAPELSQLLLRESQKWQKISKEQLDDLTWIIIDVTA